MKMTSDQLSVALTLCVTLCVTLTSANRQTNSYADNSGWGHNPRCSSSSKPCQTKVVMYAEFLLPEGYREIRSPPCSCENGFPCNEDWEGHSDHVITRQLVTNGNISMTFSIMFCHAILPKEQCVPGQVAMQLSGWTPMPTEVDFINCRCSDRKPLILHTVTTGADHREYHAFVCADHKDRCKRRRGDQCMVSDPTTHTVIYPCYCSRRTICQRENLSSLRHVCKRRHFG
ncbi:hypothetical protein ACOMHN_048163 [Nucella lapillus]